MPQAKNKKILPHHLTGKMRHHRHTSYGSLVVILVLAFLPLSFASVSVANANATDPVSDSIQVTGSVPAAPPQTAPTITTLTSGHIYDSADPVLVSGACQSGTIIKIFSNEVMLGATVCQSGRYDVLVSLFVGNDSVLARAYNINDVASPSSAPVSVQLVLPGYSFNSTDLLNTSGAPAGQFYMTGDLTHGGAAPGQEMTWPLSIQGGQPPYAISISWGDGDTEVVSRGDAGSFNITHTYKSGSSKGSYIIVIKAADQQGNTTYLQLVAVVGGSLPTSSAVMKAKQGYNNSLALRIAWQLLVIAIVIFISFWLGERREKRIMNRLIQRTA